MTTHLTYLHERKSKKKNRNKDRYTDAYPPFSRFSDPRNKLTMLSRIKCIDGISSNHGNALEMFYERCLWTTSCSIASRTHIWQTIPNSHHSSQVPLRPEQFILTKEIESLTSSWIFRSFTAQFHRCWNIVQILVLSADMHKHLAAFLDNVNPDTCARQIIRPNCLSKSNRRLPQWKFHATCISILHNLRISAQIP